MRRTALRLVIVATALSGACATPTPAHRGASLQDIHTVAVNLVERDGYKCEASPDLTWQNCTHPEKTNFAFAYLPQSNMLQVWTSFTRDDAGLNPRWRTGSCTPLGSEIGKINSETIVKLVCDETTLRFEMATWVPENGLSDDDLSAYFGLYRTVIGETIRGRGFLHSSDAPPVDAAAPADTAGPV